jgi:hypothetical protein
VGDAPCLGGCKCDGSPITRRTCLSGIITFSLALGSLGLILGAAAPTGPWLLLEHWPNATASGNATLLPSSNSSSSPGVSAYEQRHYLSGRVDLGPLCVTTASRPPRIGRSGAYGAQTSTTTCYPLPSPLPPVLEVGSLLPRVRAEEGAAAASGLIVVGVLTALAALSALAPLIDAWLCRRVGACRRLRDLHATSLWASSSALCVLSLSLFFASLAQYNEALTDPVTAAVDRASDWEAYARSEGRGSTAWPPTLPAELASLVVRQGSGYSSAAAAGALLLLCGLLNLVTGCLGRRWLLCRPPSSSSSSGEAGVAATEG